MPTYRWRRFRRFSNLPASGSPAELVANEDPKRLTIGFRNAGTGRVNLTEEAVEINGNDGWILDPGEFWSPALAPYGPHNAFYAVGDSGHDLRVYEVLQEDVVEEARAGEYLDISSEVNGGQPR